MPQLLHTDNAGNMAGSILSYIAKMLGCKKTETPSWCPRADPAETLVSCVGDLLRIHMSKKDQKNVDHCPSIYYKWIKRHSIVINITHPK
jgi:hypothetical protein